ncbi:MAG: site-specific integrase [Conexibacteraceae bacterium]|nr:site-specific integrase [Conexibacteraceae bacterium]
MSVQKRTTRRADGSIKTSWRVRWQEGEAWRSRTFDRKRDADVFDGDLRRRRRLGTLAEINAGSETLDAYVTETWIPVYASTLAPKTRRTYAALHDKHVSPHLGPTPLRELNAELIGRWQADRLRRGAGPVAVSQALGLLGNILQRAHEAGRIPSNPQRLVRKARKPRKAEVRPLAPTTIERIRHALGPRDATLVSLIAYAGLRPGEALSLHWGDVRVRTLLIQHGLSDGVVKGTKTEDHRTVRLLAPLATDLKEWRLLQGRPADDTLVIPGKLGKPWTEDAYKSWGRQAFARALALASGRQTEDPMSRSCPTCKATAGKPCRTPNGRESRAAHAARTRLDADGRPYDLRHSFASLLLHEGRSVIYVARQLGHDAQLTLSIYGHVIDELEDSPRLEAEAAIQAAREPSAAHELPISSDPHRG